MTLPDTTERLTGALLAIAGGRRDEAAEISGATVRDDPTSLLAAHLHTALVTPATDSVYDAPAAFQAFIDGGSNRELYRATIESIAEHHLARGTASLIDIGCGDGRVTAAVLPPTCTQLDLVEPSAELMTAALALCERSGMSVTAHRSTLGSALDELTGGHHDVGQSTFAMHTIAPDERQAQLRRLREIVETLLLADFDVAPFADRSADHARYAARRYELGIAEYTDDRELVAQGFLMPVLIGQFDPQRPRMTFEQPIDAWVEQLHAAGFERVETAPLADYWWAPARLVVAS